MREVKQIIVMRHDINMGNKGKYAAQACHASLAFLTRRLQKSKNPNWSKAETQWMEGSFAKVVVKVHSEEELLKVYQDARTSGLEAHLITDSGKTVFQGVPTKTCVGIGPDYVDKLQPVTGHLKTA